MAIPGHDGHIIHRIPIGARILAVTDALDTMLSPRTYKKPYSLEQARTWNQAIASASQHQSNPLREEASDEQRDDDPALETHAAEQDFPAPDAVTR